jgi:hypothetical protein
LTEHVRESTLKPIKTKRGQPRAESHRENSLEESPRENSLERRVIERTA